MPTFNSFEEIHAWQKAREATRRVYEITANNGFGKDYGLSNQIKRASVSVMANIAEGFGRHSDKEFANFLNMAHGSASETQSHLYVALDLGYVDQECFAKLYASFDEVSRMTLRLAQHLRTSKL
jgi:four helix bundle protein